MSKYANIWFKTKVLIWFSVSAYDHNQASGKAIEFINETLDFYR